MELEQEFCPELVPGQLWVLLWDLSLAFSKEKVLTQGWGVRGGGQGRHVFKLLGSMHRDYLPDLKSQMQPKSGFTPLSEILTSLKGRRVQWTHAFE